MLALRQSRHSALPSALTRLLWMETMKAILVAWDSCQSTLWGLWGALQPSQAIPPEQAADHRRQLPGTPSQLRCHNRHSAGMLLLTRRAASGGMLCRDHLTDRQQVGRMAIIWRLLAQRRTAQRPLGSTWAKAVSSGAARTAWAVRVASSWVGYSRPQIAGTDRCQAQTLRRRRAVDHLRGPPHQTGKR